MQRKKTNKFGFDYWARLRRSSLQKKPLKRTAIKKRFKPRKKKIDGIVLWYENRIAECTWICWECEVNGFSTIRNYQFAAQAHLLPKEHFGSVATHPLNYACLPATCGCHSRYDKSWMSASTMKMWPIALDRIMVLIPLLTEKEYRKLPDIIGKEYEKRKHEGEEGSASGVGLHVCTGDSGVIDFEIQSTNEDGLEKICG